jgi:hypothetical protein
MIVICPKCGLIATITLTGRDRYSTQLPEKFVGICLDVQARLKEKGKLEDTEMDCPHLGRASSIVADEWRGKRRI